jgi:hypothetical protein
MVFLMTCVKAPLQLHAFTDSMESVSVSLQGAG